MIRQKHAIKRAKERYNLDLSEQDCFEIAEYALKHGKQLIQRNVWGLFESRKNAYRISWNSQLMDVVVNNKGSKPFLRTFLPQPNTGDAECFTSAKASLFQDLRNRGKL